MILRKGDFIEDRFGQLQRSLLSKLAQIVVIDNNDISLMENNKFHNNIIDDYSNNNNNDTNIHDDISYINEDRNIRSKNKLINKIDDMIDIPNKHLITNVSGNIIYKIITIY